MLEQLPKDVREGLARARLQARRKSARLRIRTHEESFSVLRHWPGGFSLEAENAPQLRGLVDLYDGARHLSRCLIVASSEEDSEIIYEFKQVTDASDGPALDFVRDEDRPKGLLPKPT